MHWLTLSRWPVIAGVLLLALLVALVLWLIFRRKPTAEEIERRRRALLVASGRLTDGMSTDLTELEAAEGASPRLMILFTYRIGGVDYECSQDITGLASAEEIRVGFPCSVRYQPGNPHNSIVLAEAWSGLRAGLPVLPEYDPGPADGRRPHE